MRFLKLDSVAIFSNLRFQFKNIRLLGARISTADMAKADTTSKLAKLRALMKERNVHVYSEITMKFFRLISFNELIY